MSSKPSEAERRFFEGFLRIVEVHQFHKEYLARRCRTEAAVVDAWLTGVKLPTHAEWWHLRKISKDFSLIHESWRLAQEDLGLLREFDRRSDPSMVSATTVIGPVQPILEGPILEGPILEGSSGSAMVDVSSTGQRASLVVIPPEECVVYRCRITRGRLLELPLPVQLSRVDVERLCAFLRTQADDADDE